MKSDGVILVTLIPANAFFFLLLVLLVLSYLLWSMYVCSIIRQFFISPLLLLLFCGLWFSMQRPGSILPYMYMMSVLYHQYRTAGGGGASGKIIYKYIFLRGLMIKEEKSLIRFVFICFIYSLLTILCTDWPWNSISNKVYAMSLTIRRVRSHASCTARSSTLLIFGSKLELQITHTYLVTFCRIKWLGKISLYTHFVE